MARLSEKVGYGLGDMSSSMFWKIFAYYIPFFYSNVFGLSFYDAGVLLLVTRLYDAVSDPVMGILADRTKTRWGRYRPYLLWGAVPFAVIGVLTFYTPSGSYEMKRVYAYITYLLMMSVYTLVNVPYGALLGVITPGSKEKTVFASYRMFFAYGGSFLALAMIAPLQRFFEPSLNVDTSTSPRTWLLTMVVIGAICAVLFFGCFALTRERVKISKPIEEGSSILKDLKTLATNGPWWILMAAAIFTLLWGAIRGGVAAYYFNDVIGGNGLITCAIYLMAFEIANMAGVALATPLANACGKKNVFIGGLMATALLSVPISFLPPSAGGQIGLIALQVLIGIASGITFPLLWSMFADVADYSEARTGRSSTGLIFSSSSMAQKFGAAFGQAATMWILAAFGYVADVAAQTPEAVNAIKWMMGWLSAIGAFAAAAVMVLYPLTEKKMKNIETQLQTIRNAKSEDIR